MSYEIDQSIKIENTQKASYVCLANGESVVISISAKDKRELKLYFRELDKPLIFKLFTFAVLCALVIIKTKAEIISIDKEYQGHERQIKSFIMQIIEIESYEVKDIAFTLVGKKSSAHLGAYNAFRKMKSDLKLKATEVLKYYEKMNKS